LDILFMGRSEYPTRSATPTIILFIGQMLILNPAPEAVFLAAYRIVSIKVCCDNSEIVGSGTLFADAIQPSPLACQPDFPTFQTNVLSTSFFPAERPSF
jgi:hypothetical protein